MLLSGSPHCQEPAQALPGRWMPADPSVWWVSTGSSKEGKKQLGCFLLLRSVCVPAVGSPIPQIGAMLMQRGACCRARPCMAPGPPLAPCSAQLPSANISALLHGLNISTELLPNPHQPCHSTCRDQRSHSYRDIPACMSKPCSHC